MGEISPVCISEAKSACHDHSNITACMTNTIRGKKWW